VREFLALFVDFLDVNKLKGSKKGVLVSWQFKTAAPVFP